ncbi:MAG: hypothetical protein GXN92_00910 [Candidatus Micrarchaeota archaeon]|nr:hypothetical protein [Candidatus Micrarchaeota archaeon]
MLIKPEFGRTHYRFEICNYCGKLVSYDKIKASKRIKRRDIQRIVICKVCWSNAEHKKLYKQNIPKIIPYV